MAGDSSFDKVALLLFGNAFTDLSYNNTAVHAGPVTLTDVYPGVVPSSYWFQRTFTGITMYAAHPAEAEIDANVDCAIEVVFFLEKNRIGGALLSNRTPGGSAEGILIGLDATGKPFVRISADGALRIAIDGPNQPTLGALHTLKVHRKSGQWGMSLDGVPQHDLRHQPVYTGDVPHGDKIYVGCDPYTAGFVGAVNMVRWTVGDARQIGAYVPDILPWPIYDTDPNILFGSLSSSVSTRNTAATFTLDIQNAASVSVAALDGAGNPVGNSWAIVTNPIQGPNNYKVTGNAPAALADYLLVITGTTANEFGHLSKAQTYRIHNTTNGSLSAEQSLLESMGGAKLWIDASDATTVFSLSGNITEVLNKVDSLPFIPATSRPAPTLDTTAMLHNSIRFVENASSGLTPTTPVVLSDAASSSTLVLVGKYVGQALGQGAGLFQIAYTDDDARQDGTAAWVMETTQTGVANASVSMYDSTLRQNGIGTTASITPGESFIVAWNTASNKADIWLQQRHLGEIEIAGTLNFWSSVSAAIGFIGGSKSPSGAFITMGELIALDVDLTQNGNNSKLEQLISFLNHKWGIFPNVPYAQTPSSLTGFAGNPYAATTIVTDATTSVTVSASAGTGWGIAATGNQNVPGEYLITGTLPSTPQTLNLTISTNNGGVLGSDVYQIVVQALPTTPTIETPLNLIAQAGAGFASLINIFSADTVSVVGSAGSGWAITLAPENDSGNYIISGIAPDNVGSMNLTVNASKVDPDTLLTVSASSVFAITVTANLVLEPDQYQVDLTGLLAANKITDESQTLSPANGIKHQLIVPIMAPFFGDSMRVQYYATDGNRVDAVKNVDYVPVIKQGEVSTLAQTEVFSGLLLLNPQLRGTVFLTYQTVGGGFTIDRRAVLAALAVLSQRARFVAWNAVTGKPTFFPVTDHYLKVQDDLIGLSALVAILENFKNSLGLLSESDVAALMAHEPLTNNPHLVSKAQIGLPLVQNYPLASVSEAQAGTSSQRYLTPKTAIISIDANMPMAQDTVTGKFYLNLGQQVGDDTDNTKPLTGQGVVNLLISPTPNALNVLFASLINQAEQPVQATPTPLVYPLYWKGVLCNNEAEFITAVESYTGLRALRFNSALGVFYFPVDITPPSLDTLPAYTTAGSVGATVLTAVSLPLTLTN
jgi:hypothetical protein